ncbi:hypothetical protein CYMTET_46265 [Cymbomonas tetramitiformis]|uniref:Uncharacterized protein n=1 Tax=Cymbomonas tetramitiformis TaxID=36881 RepID=A0AAE0BWH0_9CHLO|nr:hypothetical protein CYMTET_46265 [Cymbomonas tetramitiformis]
MDVPPPSPSPPNPATSASHDLIVASSLQLDISQFEDEAFKASFIEDYRAELALSAEVPIDAVKVLSIYAGSVMVESQVEFEGEENAASFQTTLESEDNVFSQDFTQEYGEVAIESTTLVARASPPPSTSVSAGTPASASSDDDSTSSASLSAGVLAMVVLGAAAMLISAALFARHISQKQAHVDTDQSEQTSDLKNSDSETHEQHKRDSQLMTRGQTMWADESDPEGGQQRVSVRGHKLGINLATTVNPLFKRSRKNLAPDNTKL